MLQKGHDLKSEKPKVAFGKREVTHVEEKSISPHKLPGGSYSKAQQAYNN